jgi:hypothetical protein
VLGACTLVGAAWLAVGQAGLIAGLLTITWVAGTILVRCHRPGVYAAGILLTTGAMASGLPPMPVLGAVAVATALAAFVALRPPAAPSRGSRARWSRVIAAAAIGAGTGLLLILDPSVTWAEGSVPAVALLPSAAAGFWAAYRLRDLGYAIPRAAWGVRVGAKPPTGLGSAPLQLLLSVLCELVALAAGLSAVLVLLTPWLGEVQDTAGMLAGFGLLAPATLLAGVLESLGRGGAVLGALACAMGAELFVRWSDTAPFAGAGLVAGGAVAAALLLPVAVAVLGRPASTLATALWIT